MNVKPGDKARIVGAGQCNDGAVVRVICCDDVLTVMNREQYWVIEGADLALFTGRPWPSGIGSEASSPDRYLRRIDPDEPSVHDEQLDEVQV